MTTTGDGASASSCLASSTRGDAVRDGHCSTSRAAPGGVDRSQREPAPAGRHHQVGPRRACRTTGALVDEIDLHSVHPGSLGTRTSASTRRPRRAGRRRAAGVSAQAADRSPVARSSRRAPSRTCTPGASSVGEGRVAVVGHLDHEQRVVAGLGSPVALDDRQRAPGSPGRPADRPGRWRGDLGRADHREVATRRRPGGRSPGRQHGRSRSTSSPGSGSGRRVAKCSGT